MPTAAPSHRSVKQSRKPVRRHRGKERRSVEAVTLHQSGAWRKFSLTFRRANPLCEYCLAQGRVKACQEVDHIIPHKGDPELFWMDGNYQALCSDCHKRKRREEVRPQDIPLSVQCKPAWMLVISGPIAAGKTTEAQRVREQHGGIIYDLDAIAEDNNLPYRNRTWEQAKLALYHRNLRLRHHPEGVGLILIQSDVTASQKALMLSRFGAEFRNMQASKEQLHQRLVGRDAQ